MALSALARYMRKQKMLRFGTGIAGRRTSPRQPASPGTTRGTMGSLGYRPGMPSRDTNAGEKLDRKTLGLPELPSSKLGIK